MLRARQVRNFLTTLFCSQGAALAAAARHGLAGTGVDPFTGQTVDARSLRSRLLDHVHAALSDRGDTETITRLLQRLDDQGTGAERQRALFAAAASAPAFVEALARATLSGYEPVPLRK
jgi:carboxylate-amine ligase